MGKALETRLEGHPRSRKESSVSICQIIVFSPYHLLGPDTLTISLTIFDIDTMKSLLKNFKSIPKDKSKRNSA